MRGKRFLSELWRALSSVSFYQELPKRSLPEALKYFSFLILLAAFLLSVRFSIDSFRMLSLFELWSRERLPEIVIEKGKVSADVPQPWVEEGDHFVMVIDTTGKVRRIDHAVSQGILLTEDRLYLKRGPFETREYDLSRIEHFLLNAETVGRLRRIGHWTLPPLLLVFLFVYFWIGKLTQVLFFSLVSLLANWAARRRLSYQALLAIGFYALTPPLAFFCLVSLLGMHLPFFSIIYLSAYAALLVAVVLQVNPPRPEVEP